MRSWHHARTQLTCGLCGEAIEPQERYQSVDLKGLRSMIRCERCAEQDAAALGLAKPTMSAEPASLRIGRERLEEIANKALGRRVDWKQLKSGGDD